VRSNPFPEACREPETFEEVGDPVRGGARGARVRSVEREEERLLRRGRRRTRREVGPERRDVRDGNLLDRLP
jgi:hypothetical protein